MATNTGAKYHQEQLHRHCRVCARVVQDREFKYSCKNKTDLLRKSGIHVVNDKSHIHPESFCETCRAKAKRFSDGKQVENSLHDYQWTEHADSGCAVCSLFKNKNKGGRHSKQGKKCGHPCDKSTCSQSIANGILRNAPPSLKAATALSLSRFLPPITVSLHDLQCGICGCIVHRPVQTPCSKVVRSVCISFPISRNVAIPATKVHVASRLQMASFAMHHPL